MFGCTQSGWTAKSVRNVAAGTLSQRFLRMLPSTSDESGYVETTTSAFVSVIALRSRRPATSVSRRTMKPQLDGILYQSR